MPSPPGTERSVNAQDFHDPEFYAALESPKTVNSDDSSGADGLTDAFVPLTYDDASELRRFAGFYGNASRWKQATEFADRVNQGKPLYSLAMIKAFVRENHRESYDEYTRGLGPGDEIATEVNDISQLWNIANQTRDEHLERLAEESMTEEEKQARESVAKEEKAARAARKAKRAKKRDRKSQESRADTSVDQQSRGSLQTADSS